MEITFTHLLLAIRLVILPASITFQAGRDLSTDANTVADLDGCNLGANLDSIANNLYHSNDKFEDGLKSQKTHRALGQGARSCFPNHRLRCGHRSHIHHKR